ncbi:MAG TPA: hypothetical protein VFA60_10810 [Terriglobales bacterium]|nr:hypothetical protein [Terriglobales bacterium]
MDQTGTSPSPDPCRQLLRHTLATLAYRGAKALRGAPPEFATFSACGRTPAQILAHVCDLMDWALSMANGEKKWRDTQPAGWDADVKRFFASMEKFDACLRSTAPLSTPVEQLFQGPVADALTHVGQIAMQRRLAGCAIKGENYLLADIAAGRVGEEQRPPKREF